MIMLQLFFALLIHPFILIFFRYYRFKGITPPETGTTFSDTRNSRVSSSYHRNNSIQLEQRNTLILNKDKEIKDNNCNNNIDKKNLI